MTVRLIPAIDIQNGRCVRLRRGNFSAETVFADDPVAMARHWVEEGARYLHVVDLDGAREGRPCNLALVRAIAEAVPVPVQTGGGIRDEAALAEAGASGVTKLVLGTVAVENEDFLRLALALLGPERIVVAVDAEEGMVKTKGWQEKSGVQAVDLVRRLEALGVREVLYTDISRDGMMQSIDYQGIRELAEGSNVDLIASGGVTNLDNLRSLRRLEHLGVTAVIVGRALYEGRFTIPEALAALGEEGEG